MEDGWLFPRSRYILLLALLFDTVILALAASPQRPTLDVLAGLLLPDHLTTAIQSIDFASIIRQQRRAQTRISLRYGILKGKSALRDLDPEAHSLLAYLTQNDEPRSVNSASESASYMSKTAVALLLLVGLKHRQSTDAAHEVILGVTLANLDDAEYAASHPGQTTWSKDHQLTDCDDMLHSVTHRICEGSLTGEGGYAGWENAAYWAAGGPKLQYGVDGSSTQRQHPVRAALASAALHCTPCCVQMGVVCSSEEQQHRIIAGGGRYRMIEVPTGWWDPCVFINLLQSSNRDLSKSGLQCELDWLQEIELRLLLRFELLKSQRGRSEDSAAIDMQSLLVFDATTI